MGRGAERGRRRGRGCVRGRRRSRLVLHGSARAGARALLLPRVQSPVGESRERGAVSAMVKIKMWAACVHCCLTVCGHTWDGVWKKERES